jgi:hypothetical protein
MGRTSTGTSLELSFLQTPLPSKSTTLSESWFHPLSNKQNGQTCNAVSSTPQLTPYIWCINCCCSPLLLSLKKTLIRRGERSTSRAPRQSLPTKARTTRACRPSLATSLLWRHPHTPSSHLLSFSSPILFLRTHAIRHHDHRHRPRKPHGPTRNPRAGS